MGHLSSVYGYPQEVPEEEYLVPIGVAQTKHNGSDATVVATGRRVAEALPAAERLAEQAIQVEVIDLWMFKPLDTVAILQSVEKTGRLVIVNEGCRNCGFAAEIAARVAEDALDYLDAPVHRVTTEDVPMPVAKELEKEIVPGREKIVPALQEVMA